MTLTLTLTLTLTPDPDQVRPDKLITRYVLAPRAATHRPRWHLTLPQPLPLPLPLPLPPYPYPLTSPPRAQVEMNALYAQDADFYLPFRYQVTPLPPYP